MVILMVIAVRFDGLEAIVEWAEDYEAFEIDEVITFLILLSVAATFFAIRRLSELRAEIARRNAVEASIRHMATHDGLTDLLNRTALDEVMARELARGRRDGHATAVLVMDIDRFKTINDTFGHPGGDAVLREVARRLLRHVRETDYVARLGGDEFVIVQTEPADPGEVETLARRLLAAMSEPLELGGDRLPMGASFGCAMAPSDAQDAAGLIKLADAALYRAKSDGRGTFRFFEPGMDEAVRSRRLLEADLRRALGAGELEVYYQPQVALDGRHCVGFEALARWHHPGRGQVSPAEFIPVAEETGQILAIGEFVLRRACTDALRWPQDVRISVNLSPTQFQHRDLVDLVDRVLTETGLPATRLELEITEGVLMRDTEATLATLGGLKALGVLIAMDDFGTGYSSLSYLRRFPFDRIKIDRSFIRDLGTAGGDASIIAAIVSLSRNLGMHTTAEGVEEEDQLRFLEARGCEEVQGFLLGRPMPVGAVPDWLARHAGTATRIGPAPISPA